MNPESILAAVTAPNQMDQLIHRALETAAVLLITFVILYFARKGLALGFRQAPEAGSLRRASLAVFSSESRRARLKTLADSLYHLLSLGIWFIAVLTILSGWNINVTPLLTGAGLVGLAIGLGSQTLIKDLVAGFFLILENQYNQGDVVTLAGVKGTVQKITLRTTTLRDQEGNTSIITNSQILLVTRHAERGN